MKGPTWVEVALFGAAGATATCGGLLWTGLYGVPHHGGLGLVLFVAGLVAATVFVALVDGELDEVGQPHDGPPQ